MIKWMERQALAEQAQEILEEQELDYSGLFAEDAENGRDVDLQAPLAHIYSASEFKKGDFYTWKEGDDVNTLYDLSRKMDKGIEEIKAFNEIDFIDELEPGVRVYYPYVKEAPAPTVRYEVYPDEIPMHVRTPGGCQKWAFNNMKKWDDAVARGNYPEGTNLWIKAVAYVPLDEPEKEAAYYLDFTAAADIAVKGYPRFALGYANQDLEPGHVDPHVKLAPVEKVVPKLEETVTDQPEPNLYDFTQDYQELPEPVLHIIMLPPEYETVDETGKKCVLVEDFGQNRPAHRMYDCDDLWIAGTFPYYGKIYGRPAVERDGELVVSPYWFGIDMDFVQPQIKVLPYNEKVAPSERKAISVNRLTWSERLWDRLCAWLYVHYPGYMRDIKNKKRN